MPRVDRLKLDWEGDGATAPNGDQYGLFSEHVRGEARFYWPERWDEAPVVNVLAGPDGAGTRVGDPKWVRLDDEPPGYTGRKYEAVRWAEQDAARREEGP